VSASASRARQRWITCARLAASADPGRTQATRARTIFVGRAIQDAFFNFF
jgi:hypothetical protein